MSRLNDIKQKILQLDGGTFQNLCDIYLCKLGYENVMSLGMKSGTNKTTKGIPDTYFYNSSGKYILAMYTTQQSNIYNKIHEDIIDCLNAEKTGISEEKIAEIICCHTSDKISVGQDEKLRELCSSNDISLQLKGIDQIANDIYKRYPILAKDFLDISISTEQIYFMPEFINKHDQNKMSAPLSTDFKFRKKEIEEFFSKLNKSEVIVITGQAGVGKTKLALECGKRFISINDYKFYCIKSNNLPIYEDLKIFLDKPGNYLILVDDANQVTNLNYILDYLTKENQGYNIKIILTVRDYAKKSVIHNIYDFTNPEILIINTFSDEEIEKILKDNLNILNENYLKKILNIAEGNARLAMLAGKIAVDTQSLNSISDATELYESYYGSFISKNIDNNNLYAVAGIISFLNAINFKELNLLLPVLEKLNLSESSFVKYTKELHNLEFVDIYDNKVVKISDQSFSNYLLKYVFIDKKIIPYSTMVRTFFNNCRSCVINSTNILTNIFISETMIEELKYELGKVWDDYKNEDNSLFFEYVKAFHLIRPIETLMTLKKMIDGLSYENFKIEYLDFDKKNHSNRVDDDILKILGNFHDREELPEALELFFLYLNKQPQKFMEFYNVIINYFSINKISNKNNYWTQIKLLNNFNQYSNNWEDEIITFLFIKVASKLLQLSFSPTEMDRGKKITIYQISLQYSKGTEKYRGMIWENLLELYILDKYRVEIERIILKYNPSYGEKVDSDIVSFDYKYIKLFFKNNFSSQNLSHCILAKKIMDKLKFHGIKASKELSSYLTNSNFIIYKILSGKYYRTKMDWEKEKKLNENEIEKLANNCNKKSIMKILNVCIDYEKTDYENTSKIKSGLQYLFETLSTDKQLFLFIIDKYLEKNTPLKINPSPVIKELFKIIDYKNVYELINQYNYDQRNTWEFSYYENLPSKFISKKSVAGLYQFLSKREDENLKSSPYRDLSFLENYKKVEPDIFIKVSRIIIKKYEYSPFVFSIYFGNMFNQYINSPEYIINIYKENMNLLKNIYLKLLKFNDNIDHYGDFLLTLINYDSSFIKEYLDFLIKENDKYFYKSNNRLSVIWNSKYFIDYADKIFNNVIKYNDLHLFEVSRFIESFIISQNKEENIAERQDKWIEHFININNDNQKLMKVLFSSITKLSANLRRKHILHLIQKNSDPDLFKSLQLQTNIYSGRGSFISNMENKINFLSSLLPEFVGIEYIEHKVKIKEDIKNLQRIIEKEKINKLLEFN